MGIVVFALEVLNALILFGNWENEPYKQKGTQSKKTKQVYYAKKKKKKKEISKMEQPCCTISEAQCYTLRLWWKPFIHQFCKWSHFAFDKVMHECTLVSTGMLQLSSCTSVFTFYSLKKRKGWIETHWSITNIWMFSFGTLGGWELL